MVNLGSKSGFKHEAVYQDLLSEISTGTLKPGHRLPTEAEFAESYRISRASVRQALSRLHRRGLVEKKQGSGTYVSSGMEASSKNRNPMVWVRSNYEIIGSHADVFWPGRLQEGLGYGALLHNLQIVYESPAIGRSTVLSQVPVGQLAGIVAVLSGSDDVESLLAGVAAGIPKIIVNRRSVEEGIPSIDIDQESGAFQATSFLLKFGHRRIMMVSMDPPSVTMQQRVQGYRRAFNSGGLIPDETLIVAESVGEKWSTWPTVFRAALTRQPHPTAILMGNQGRALHALEILRSENLRVPEDISLIIFDDDPSLLHCKPSLTCVRQPLEQMGKMAMDIVKEMSVSEVFSQGHRTLQPELILRESVGPPREI